VTPIDKNHEPLDTILRRAMRAQPGAATPECADATALAAYSDRSLDAVERERLEAHFADCSRCQLILADIARAGENASDARAASGVPWYRRWRIAIPALAAVGAILVFIAIRRPVNEEARSNEVVAMAKRESPELAAPEPAAAPEMPEVASAPAPAAPAPAPPPPASNEIPMNEAKAPAAAPRAEAMNGTALHRMQTGAAVPGRAGAMFAHGAESAAKTGAMQSYSAADAGAIAAPNAAIRQSAEVLAMISPPDRSVIWSVGKNGMILRLDPPDGRRHPQQSGVSTDLVAGAAPSSSVCWVVGSGGTILRTIDGEHWERITAPTTENLVTVSSSSAGDATVTTASSKSFATSDGGASWHQQ
jgi:Putative zinc-finger